MLKDLCRLVESVMCRDRIRVPPSEGRLLRLSPPCALMIGTETLSIVGRTVCETAKGPRVTYACETDFGEGNLVIQLSADFRCEATWKSNGRSQSVAEDDIVVFG